MPRTQIPKHRSDALRNRGIILRAAREVFAEVGIDASLSLVVERSGLGRGSLYRHFPNRYSLISAIFDENFTALEERAAKLDGKPGKFRGVLTLLIQQLIEARGFVTLLLSNGSAQLPLRDHQEHLRTLLETLIVEGHRDGEIEETVSVEDLILIISMLAGLVLHHPSEELPLVMRNALRIVGLPSLLP
ncbi:MAG: helix-turn-helix domain-containing protein [Microbacteriaceae bacterium]